MCGRDDEVTLLLTALDEPGASVVVAGGVGVGKTRLQRELLRSIEAKGRAVRRVVGTPSARAIPLGVLIPLLGEPPSTQLDRSGVLRWASEALTSMEHGSVVAVDDAQFLDVMSAAVLHQVVVARALSVVFTVRSGEAVPPEVLGLWKDGYAMRVELQPLSRQETELLVSSVLGGTVETTTLRRLWDATAGNPLFIRELVIAALRSEALQNTGGPWTWTGPAQSTALLDEIVKARLAELTSTALRTAELLAVGEPLAPDLLRRLAPNEVLATLERSGIVTETADGGEPAVRFAHPIYGEVLRASMTPIDSQDARQRLIDAFSEAGVTAPYDVLRMAVWHLDAGGPRRGDLLEAGARQANHATDWALGERLARAAHGLNPTASNALTLARALHELGRHEECVAVASEFVAEDSGDEVHGELAHVTFDACWTGLDRPDEAVRVITEAITKSTHLPTRQRLVSFRARLIANDGAQDLVLTDAMAAVGDPHHDPVARATHAVMAAIILAAAGRPVDAISLIDEQLGGIVALGDEGRAHVGEALATRLMAQAFSTDTSAVLDTLRAFYDSAVAAGDETGRAVAAQTLGLLHLIAGRPRTAREFIDISLALLRRRGRAGRVDWTAAGLAEACALTGDTDAAERALTEARRLKLSSGRFHQSEIERSAAWVFAARGELTEARHHALLAADEAHDSGWTTFELFALHDLVRLGGTEHTGRLVTLASAVQGDFAAAVAVHATGLTGGGPKLLGEAADRFAAVGRVIQAAEASAQAAAAFLRDGLPARASAWAARSLDLAARCEGTRTPVLADALQPVPLTRREREIAAMAAAGVSNADIAERLVLSRRTVEGHLHRLYAKLGVQDRDGLRAVLAAGARNA